MVLVLLLGLVVVVLVSLVLLLHLRPIRLAKVCCCFLIAPFQVEFQGMLGSRMAHGIIQVNDFDEDSRYWKLEKKCIQVFLTVFST
jgi:hypothetical protein